MLTATEWAMFTALCFSMSATPGPNMVYLSSRALCQGQAAALTSLWGVATGFLVHLTVAATGLAAILNATPWALTGVRLAGVAYLLWLAWKTLRPANGGWQTAQLPAAGPGRLFFMGFMTNVLNPQAALLYLSIFSQFVRPERGPVLRQGLQLGAVQIAISVAVNTAVILLAGRLAGWLAARPWGWKAQRGVMGSVLAALALRLALGGTR
jgi:threonine/homoserine/homoserine lactone efflux protein